MFMEIYSVFPQLNFTSKTSLNVLFVAMQYIDKVHIYIDMAKIRITHKKKLNVILNIKGLKNIV